MVVKSELRSGEAEDGSVTEPMKAFLRIGFGAIIVEYGPSKGSRMPRAKPYATEPLPRFAVLGKFLES